MEKTHGRSQRRRRGRFHQVQEAGGGENCSSGAKQTPGQIMVAGQQAAGGTPRPGQCLQVLRKWWKGSNAGCMTPFIKAHRSFPKPSTIKAAPIPKVPVAGPPANEWLLRSKVGLLLCAAGPGLARSLCRALVLSELPHHPACISISKPHLPSTHPLL